MEERLELPERLVIPVFPLPNAILFPGMQLRLYIFEPRYKQMIDDCLREKKYMSVALMVDREGEKTPAPISGMGQITDVEQLPRNEKNIIVRGLVRVRLNKFISREPYVSAEALPLDEIQPDVDAHERLFARLREAVKLWLFRMRSGKIRLLAELGQVKTVGEMCDFFGAYLIDDFGTRQQLLEQLDVTQRAEMILELVASQLYYYSAPFEN